MSVMLIHFGNQYYLDVLERLLEKGVEISHIVRRTTFKATKYNHLFQEDRFVNVTTLVEENFRYAQCIHTLNKGSKTSLSADLLESFVSCESLFLSISDRFSYFPLSVQERKRLYQELLLYWYTYLKASSIKTIIMGDIPHLGWDNIIYEVAKRLNIQVWCVLRTFKDRIALLDDFRKIDKVPVTYLHDLGKEELVQRIGPGLLEDLDKPSGWLKRSQQKNRQTVLRRGGAIKKTTHKVREIFSKVNQHKWKLFHNLVSPAFERAVFFNNPYRSLTLHCLRLFQSLKAQRIYRFYHRHTSTVDHEDPYVFVAFHYQPEKNTTPRGGVFEDQLLLLDVLRKSLPNDWTIYVKEHPREFSGDLDTKHFRSIEYYTRVLATGQNIKLVDIQEDSERLVAQAILTVTITGSSGWQSLLHNKPCLAFGTPWYAACQSCYLVRSVEECQQAIKTLLDKTPAEVELDVLRFLAYYQDKFIVASNKPKLALQSDIEYEVLVDNMAAAIIKHLE